MSLHFYQPVPTLYPFYPVQLSFWSPVPTSHQSYPEKTITCHDCDLHYAWRRHYSSSAANLEDNGLMIATPKFIAVLYNFKEVWSNWKCCEHWFDFIFWVLSSWIITGLRRLFVEADARERNKCNLSLIHLKEERNCVEIFVRTKYRVKFI